MQRPFTLIESSKPDQQQSGTMVVNKYNNDDYDDNSNSSKSSSLHYTSIGCFILSFISVGSFLVQSLLIVHKVGPFCPK